MANPPVEPVIDRLRAEGLSHQNELTGCEIWTGDTNRKHQPVYGTTLARDYMYQAASGDIVKRGEEVKTLCENPLCILPAHLEKISAKPKAVEALPEADLDIVEVEYFDNSKRVETIAEANNWSRPYTTKLVAAVRLRRGKTE